MYNKVLCISLLLIMIVSDLIAQDSLTIKESQNMKFIAEDLIAKRLLDLYIAIADPSNENKEINDIIDSSVIGKRRKLFFDEKVTIENDIDPTKNQSSSAVDLQIKNYLQDFRLYFEKNPETQAVSFSGIKCSNVKKVDFTYIKVYFTVFYNGKNRAHSEVPLEKSNRVAEIKMTKTEDKWKGYIAGIRYYLPQDTLNDFANDIPINLSKEDRERIAATADSSVVISEVSFKEKLEEEAKLQYEEEEKAERDKYSAILKQGDQALQNSDYTEALRLYKSAGDMRPYETAHLGKIRQANKAREAATVDAERLFNECVKKGNTFANKRLYEEAINELNKAIELKPEKSSELNPKIKALSEIKLIIDIRNESYKLGQYKATIDDYDKDIKKNKNVSDYYMGRGMCYDKRDDFKDALRDYQKAIELDQFNLEAIRLTADLYTRKKMYPESIGFYKKYLNIDKTTPKIYIDYADVRMLMNSREEALNVLNDGIKNNPKDPSLYLKKGILQYGKNDFKSANESLSNSIDLANDDPISYFYRGQTQIFLGNVSKAANDFGNARNFGLDSNRLAEVGKYAERFFSLAETRFNEARYDSAVLLIDAAISINPYKSIYHFRKGDFLSALKNFAKAIQSYDEAIRLDPKYINAFYKRGLAYYSLNNYIKAIPDFNQAAQLNPKLFLAQKGAGDAHFKLREFQDAVNNLETSYKTINDIKNPEINNVDYSDLCNTLGKAYFEVKNYEKSLTFLRLAIKKNPSMAEAYFNKGITNYYKGEAQEASEDITKALSLENKYPHWQYFGGKTKQAIKAYGPAIENYTEALKSDTFYLKQDALYNRGLCNYLQKNYPATIKDYLAVEESYASSLGVTFQIELGYSYLNTNAFDSSLAAFNKVIEKDPMNAPALYGKATVIFLKGQVDESISIFETILKNKLITEKEIRGNKLLAPLQKNDSFKAILKKY